MKVISHVKVCAVNLDHVFRRVQFDVQGVPVEHFMQYNYFK